VLDSLGITNAFAGVGANYTQISREDVITADPDIIFVTYSGPDDKATAIANATSLFAGSKAVTDGKVFGQDENAYQAGGIRIVDVVEQSAKDAFGSE
jgi:iron complex transport system substrate-binding protein